MDDIIDNIGDTKSDIEIGKNIKFENLKEIFSFLGKKKY